MYSFNNDYSEGACPQIMTALMETNQTQSVGYGLDPICEEAKVLIKKQVHQAQCDVHFLVGGTQANLTVIAAALRPYEAVIAVDSGHINVHETGSIEACGHKVVIGEGENGKLSAKGIENVVLLHHDEHMVKPRMVYISNATEIGTIYSLAELKEIRAVCDQYDLVLFMDGARLPMALSAKGNDLDQALIAQYCDVFYLGGTKCGALFGEAVLIMNEDLKKDFRYMIKQRGGMLAKGRLLGIQFRELFKANSYMELANHAVTMAQKMSEAMKELGIPFFVDSPTNQIFPILSNKVIEKLEESYTFQEWEVLDETKRVMRFVTSWATKEAVVEQFIIDITKAVSGE